MSFLYIRGRKVWFSYVNRRRKRIQMPTGHYVDPKGRIPAEAKQWKRDFDDKIAHSNFGLEKPRIITVPSLHELYQRYKAARIDSKKKSTWKVIDLAFSKLLDVVHDIDADQLNEDAMIRWRNLSRKTNGDINTHTYLRMLNPIFRWAVEKELLLRNPITSDVRFKISIPSKPNYTPVQLEAFWNHAKEHAPHVYYQTKFLYYTAFRSSDSCTFLWNQVNFETNEITYFNQKVNRQEIFPLYRELKELLLELKGGIEGVTEGKNWVFHFRTYSGLNHAVKDINRLLKFPEHLCVHTFKSNAADFFISKGMNAFDVSALLHHASMQTTKTHYIRQNLARVRDLLNGQSELDSLRNTVREQERLINALQSSRKPRKTKKTA